MKSTKIPGEIFFLITALIWGTSLVAQRVGMEYIGPFTFTAIRFCIGTLSLLVLIFIMGGITRKTKKTHFPEQKKTC